MLQETRLHRIRALLAALNQVSTERISKELAISRETARRDMIVLEAQGTARRVHGGLVAIDTQPEPPLKVRSTVLAREKRAIARLAASYVQPGQTLFLDAGSTTTMLADELRARSGLTIVTNSLQAALMLTATEEPDTLSNKVILLGGNMVAGAQQTRGEFTINEIHHYHADIALLSPVGIDNRNGASSFHAHEAAIARAMSRQSDQLILLADHSKLGVASRVVYAIPQEISILITDRGAVGQDALTHLTTSLPKVVIA